MLGKSVLTAGLAATVAQAFVVIPIADADRAISDLLPFDAPARAEEQSVDISCPGCPVEVGSSLVSGVPNHLEMVFSIAKSANGDSLLANGFELYPNPDPFTSSLVAPQVPELDDVQEPIRTKVQQLGYKFHVYPIAKEEEGQHLELIGVDLSIIEVGGSFIKGIPEVKVQLVKNGDRLAIAEVVAESPRLPDFGAHCTTLFCKWKAFFTERMAMLGRPGASCHDDDASPPDSHDPPFRPPHGRPHGPPHGGPPPPPPPPPPSHGHPHGPPPPPPPPHGRPHWGPHGALPGGLHSSPLGMPHGIPPHHPAMSPGGFHEGQFPHPGPFHHRPPGHRHHGLSHVFFMFLIHILLPILTGIIAGITASLIGMALVSIVVRVFRVLRGRRSSPEEPPSYKADPAEAIMSEEKAGLIQEEDDDVEPPPSYSDDATPAAKQ